MDKAISVAAALRAGKQPSQSQTNAWIEKLLQCDLLQIEKTDDVGELSQNGKRLARDLRAILEAYKGYSSQKNGTIFAVSYLHPFRHSCRRKPFPKSRMAP
jgi:Family of unknown function (DUF5923)